MSSSIVRDEKTERKLLDLLDFEDQKWRLLYRANQSGFTAKDFHEKCDGRCNTLTLVRSIENDRIFGGYTGGKWSSNAGFVTDPHAFVFSLDDGLVARCIEPERAIYCKPMLGPTFGDNDIKIADLSNTSDHSNCAVLNVYQIDRDDDLDDSDNIYLAGNHYFKTSDIEVYCKDYNELTNVIKFF